MTADHLLFASATTAYILIGIALEERDLIHLFGDQYRRYRRQVGIPIPLPGRRHVEDSAAAELPHIGATPDLTIFPNCSECDEPSQIKKGFRIHINGYGNFPVEWLDLGTAIGRSHIRVKPGLDACVYAPCLVGRRVDDAVARQWQRRRHELVGTRRADTADRFFEREDTVTLSHELIFHCIRGRHNHLGNFDESIERRAAANWLHDNSLASQPLPSDADCTPPR